MSYADLGIPGWACCKFRVDTVGNDAEACNPFRAGDLAVVAGAGGEVWTPGGKGILFFGIVSRRYG